MADAGRILIIPKGNYDASVSYEMLDLVLHNDISWLAKKPVIGIEPSNENSAYWARLTGTPTLGGETAEEWQKKIDNIINGTTAVGNALQLGGKGASEYALAEELEAYTFDTNSFYDQTSCQNFIDNYSNDFENSTSYEFWLNSSYSNDTILGGGRWKIIGNKATDDYETQLAIQYADKGFVIKGRSKFSGTWGTFGAIATTADLANYLPNSGGKLSKGSVLAFEKTDDSTLSGDLGIGFYGNAFEIWERGGGNRGAKLDLSKCASGTGSELLHSGNVDDYSLPRDGGDVDGNVTLLSDSAVDRNFTMKNSKREILSRVSDGGGYILHDITNAKRIIESALDGTNTFNGTATGNLPLSGGGTVTSPYGTVMTLRSTGGNEVVMQYRNSADDNEGSLGFNGIDSPIFKKTDGTNLPLHHDGNSAKVIVSQTPLTAEGSVRVW